MTDFTADRVPTRSLPKESCEHPECAVASLEVAVDVPPLETRRSVRKIVHPQINRTRFGPVRWRAWRRGTEPAIAPRSYSSSPQPVRLLDSEPSGDDKQDPCGLVIHGRGAAAREGRFYSIVSSCKPSVAK